MELILREVSPVVVAPNGFREEVGSRWDARILCCVFVLGQFPLSLDGFPMNSERSGKGFD